MDAVEIRQIGFETEMYFNAVELRRKLLRIPLGLDFSEAELKAEQSEIHFVAVRENRVIGCLLLRPLSSSIIKMRQVAVDEGFQGCGVGQKLVARAEEFAKAAGYSQIVLHARENILSFY